ncbi:MAG: hypothetical protein ChlgKO_08140 [Chlamydiales bacterium]
MKKIVIRASILSIVLFVLLLFRVPTFTSSALFQDQAPVMKMQSSLMPFLRGLDRGQEEGHAKMRMTTNRILGSVIAELGLQVKRRELNLSSRLLENLRAEIQLPVSQEAPQFSHVVYEGEEVLKFSLNPLDEMRFVVKDRLGITLGAGSVDQVCDLGSFSFTLHHLENREQYFVIQPKWKVIKKLKSKIRIRKNRDDAAILKLFCTYPNRYLAQQVVQKVVHCYQQELKEEKRDVALEQLVHLENRRDLLQQIYREKTKQHLQQTDKRSYEEQRALQGKVSSQFLTQVEKALGEVLANQADKRSIESEMLLNQKMQKALAQMIEDRKVEANIRPLRSKLIDPATLPAIPDRPLLLVILVASIVFFSFVQTISFSVTSQFTRSST